MPGLVVGHDAPLVVGYHPARLHAGHHALQRRLEVDRLDDVAVCTPREDGGLVADVGQIRARQSAGLARHHVEVDIRGQRLAARVHAQDVLAALEVRRGDEDLAVEASRAQQCRVELVEQVGGRDHHQVLAPAKAVQLHEQLVERLVLLARDVGATCCANRVELVDEHDRRGGFACLAEQAPDAGGAQAGEHLHERRGRLRIELGVGLVRHGLGEQRLAGAGRTVEQDALGHLGAQLAKALGVAQELDHFAQLVLGLLDTGDVGPADRVRALRLDLLRLGARHEPQRVHEHDGDQAHEDDRQPDDCPVLDLVPGDG